MFTLLRSAVMDVGVGVWWSRDVPGELGRGQRCQASPLVSDRSVSRLVGQSVGQLVGRPAGQSVCRVVSWSLG